MGENDTYATESDADASISGSGIDYDSTLNSGARAQGRDDDFSTWSNDDSKGTS